MCEDSHRKGDSQEVPGDLQHLPARRGRLSSYKKGLKKVIIPDNCCIGVANRNTRSRAKIVQDKNVVNTPGTPRPTTTPKQEKPQPKNETNHYISDT